MGMALLFHCLLRESAGTVQEVDLVVHKAAIQPLAPSVHSTTREYVIEYASKTNLEELLDSKSRSFSKWA